MKSSKAFEHLDGSEIAVIGMAGRFPGAENLDRFWDNLRDGVESITFFTDEQLQASGVNPEMLNNGNYVKARPVLEDVELFDAAFFGFSPREAECMDPQHRLFMECVWNAIETAGYDAESYKGAIGVYAGTSMSSYLVNNLYANPEAMTSAGEFQCLVYNNPASLTTAIAYKLNLKGPCYTIQTFCSTSLVAVHVACQSLLNFECDMAVAGGVSVFVPQNTGYWYQEGLIVSPDGHCRAFDAKAQGTVFGNGLGAVVLKRLEDALSDGDHIEAVIKGSATNNDGSLKVSYTAPSVAGQAEVIVEALANAGVEPETITYVEAHGTGTALGDPTEVTALTRAFHSVTQNKDLCAIGSVKSNIGHLDVAAGVAGLIKTILVLKHRTIPPSLHFETPNPEIDFENNPFYVNSRLSEWTTDGDPRRAGVSSFGFGGTNAHVIVQEAPVREPSGASRSHQLLVLSAKTGTALETATKNLNAYFKQHPELPLSDAAYTLQVGRKAFSHRRMVVCQDVSEAVSILEAEDPKTMLTVYQEQRNPPVAFMFSGQGAQYVDMGLELYRTESKFQEEIDRCSEILKPHLPFDLRDILYPGEKNVEKTVEKLKQTRITQPALFVIEYALAKLWMSWGIHPEVLVGHSIGEYVAACLAGVFSLEDALSLVTTRGRLMHELPGGSMLAVPLSEKEIQSFLSKNLSLAAINAPSLCVVSGEKEAVEALEKQLSNKNLDCRHLYTSHAFHSQMMGPILDTFTEQVRKIRVHPPQIPFVANATGTWITSNEAMNPSYWAKHLRQTVRFSDCVQELLKEPNRVLLEVGPGQTLCTLARQHPNKSKEQIVLSSIRHPKEKKSDVAFILNTLGRLWLAGIQVDWAGFYANESRHRIPLPTYPFERKHYWVEAYESGHQGALSILQEKAQTPISNLLHQGETRLVANQLEKAGKFSEDEVKLLPKLLEVLVEQHQQQLMEVSIKDLLYEIQWLPQPRLGSQLPPDYMLAPKEISTRLVPQLAKLMARPDMEIYGELLIQLEALSVAYVLGAFREMGWEFQLKKRFSTAFIAQELNVVTRHHRLLGRLLEILAEEGVLQQTGSKWEVTRVPENEDPQEHWSTLLTKYPAAEAELTLLGRCGSRLAQVLRGECEPLELLFPEGDLTIATMLYQDAPVAREMNDLVQEAVLSALERLPQGRRVQILEIGAGTGGTTSRILPHLPSHQTEYVFTDISILFTTNAQEKFHDYTFVRYEVLDIEQDPEAQAFGSHQFDLILATNVLHATRDLRQTLRHVQQLLAPRGILLLLETTARQRWLDLIFGLLEGWWRFADIDLRPSYPLLSVSQWQELLEENGFKQAVTIDPAQEREGGLLHQAVIVAQAAEIRPEQAIISELGNWLILADAQGTGQQLATILGARGEICTLVFTGKKFEQLSEHEFKIDPACPEEFQRLLETVGTNKLPLRGVVHLWSLDATGAEALTSEDLKAALQRGCGSTLHMVNALVMGGFSEPPSLFLVTRGAQPVGIEHDVPGLAQSPLWGMGKVIALEHAELNCLRVDLDPVAREDDAQALFEEIWSKGHEDQVAFRDKIRHVARLVRSARAQATVLRDRLHFRSDSTYLITHGLGGLGLLVARWMVERGAQYLVLAGRNGVNDNVSSQLKKLEQEDIRVVVAQADMSNQEDIMRLLADIEQSLPPLRGIIHSAPVSDDGIPLHQNREPFAWEMAPQLEETWNLHTLTRDMPLDFFVMFSSVTSLLGNSGQDDCVMANAFLDALAYYRREQGLPGLNINWGFLAGVEEDARSPLGEQMRKKGMGTIAPEQGLKILENLLSQSFIQVEVMPVNWPTFMQQFPPGGEPPFLSEFARHEQQKAKDEQPTAKKLDLSSQSQDIGVASMSEIELSISEIWQKLLGIEHVDIHDNFFDLGGSSLMALPLFAQIEKIFGKKLPLATLYEAPTVEQLASILCKEEWTAPWSSLVEIQSGGSKPPFFCMHGAGGNILMYRDLAYHLGPDQPVYGLQSQGLGGEQPFHTRIEDMAAHYVKEIQAVQPEGPYFLGGYCMGGTVALEMAQQLHAQGQEVALLALLETYNWANIKDKSLLDDLYFYIQKIEFHWRNFLLLESTDKRTFILEKAKELKRRSKLWYGMVLSKFRHRFPQSSGQYLTLAKLWENNDQATLNYVPKVYPGRITQIRPIREYALHDGPEMGWDKLAVGGVEICRLYVYPAGMLVEPYVRILAEKLEACIDEAFEK